ncbi:uncharacterized protein LOC111085396 [Limulus polyphemus]|uniref:Uncharacterized protein LOC111085396 n=1 Tax=Limulus polyphemus TaxID=6850 RepID=A0ABM1S748_LIMPO|nr:uncharacterized protein LOC111085396 [Limulus polyphemus]
METTITGELVGRRVQITTDDGIYKGLVKTFNAALMKITLYNVFSCSTNKPLHGLHHFYEHEIKEFVPVGRTASVKSLVLSEQQKKGKILNKHPEIPQVDGKFHKHFQHYQKNCGIKTRHIGPLNFLINCGITDDDVLEEAARRAEGKEDSGYTTHCKNGQTEPTNVPLSEEEEEHFQPPTLRFQLSADFVVIDEIGDVFFDAVNCLKNQAIIGVSMEPGSINRTGELCWLSIGTKDYVFLYDIFSLGKQAFQQGLKEIMESLSILKVRKFFGKLFYFKLLYKKKIIIHSLLIAWAVRRYKITCVTQIVEEIGDVLVQRQENEKLRCQTRHLSSCLTDYLQLSNTEICVKWFSQDLLNKDTEVWKRRPLPPILLEAAVKRVIYLRELRVAVMEKLLTEFTSAVNSSLSLIRDMSHEELDNSASFSVILPPIFSNLQSKPRKKASQSPKFLPPGNLHQEDKFWHTFPSQEELNLKNTPTLWKSTNSEGENHIHQKIEISNKNTNFQRHWTKKQKYEEVRRTGLDRANETSSPSETDKQKQNQALQRINKKGLSSKNWDIQQKEAHVISNHTKKKKVSWPSVSESESPSNSQCVHGFKNLEISNKEKALSSQKQCSSEHFTLSSSNYDLVPLKDKLSDTVSNSVDGRYQETNFWPKVKPSTSSLTIIPAGMQQELRNSSTQATGTNNDKDNSASQTSMRSKSYFCKNFVTSTPKGYTLQSQRNCTLVHSFTATNENAITGESDQEMKNAKYDDFNQPLPFSCPGHVHQPVGGLAKVPAGPELQVCCKSSKNLLDDSEDLLNRVEISTVSSKSQSLAQQSDYEELSNHSVKQSDRTRSLNETSKSQSLLHNSSSENMLKDSINHQVNTKTDSMRKEKSVLYGMLEALLSNRT